MDQSVLLTKLLCTFKLALFCLENVVVYEDYASIRSFNVNN